ncbi:RICIN domain-containing protein [Streptomyces coffeae]|uniref:Ricin-type beta-trefoil lectin domain protein n=1 Tax=Streptomyces coffeae TaxID=621382 RepID=A0ABS1NJP6_9ACTN|nr:RICIN domain-containing protein [Streptomyces coffeae]MBL1100261.1 ricin-type beta-trefoil lectin domain protein [Streptomyces coffeae]
MAALISLAAVAFALTTAGTASAEPDTMEGPLTALPASEYKQFRLNIDRASNYDAYGAAIRGVEKSGKVTTNGPLGVALSGQHAGRPLCHTTGLNGTFQYNGFCWDPGDDTSPDWTPQGLTASHDADPSGTYSGHHLYVATWHYKNDDAYARISIVNSTGKEWTYGHVLLVEPTGDENNGNFKELTKNHADGAVWYGNKLFVANGNTLQVYDFQHLWKMQTISEDVGIKDGVSSAAHHQWALPMVGKYTIDTSKDDPRACPAPHVTGRACLGSLSLDRSGSVDHLVSGEYYKRDHKAVAHLARWPLNPATDLPAADNGDTIGSTTASGGFKAPVRQLQGVATDGTYYYMAAECPEGYMGENRPWDSYSCIYQAKPGEVGTVLTRSPMYTQNLSYSPSSGRLWGQNEVKGQRSVFSLKPRAADHSVYLRNSYSALCAGGGGKTGNGAPVIQWGCNNARDERWVFEKTTDSNGKTAYFVRNEYSGKCMGAASHLNDGSGMIQYTCNGAVDEKWWYDSGTKALRNVYSGKCLALGATATKGTQLIQYTCNGKPDESWEQIPR